jgi:hypothetical protein
MEKGLRDAVRVHEVAPCVGVRARLVGVPERSPLLAGQLPPAALAVRSLKSALACDDRVAVAAGPRRVSAPEALLTDVDRVEHQRRVGDHHVADHRPRVSLPRQDLVVERVTDDPAVQGAGIVGPGEREI